MSDAGLPSDFIKLLSSVTARRAKVVIDHLLEHGRVTTKELTELYGYQHPPRAIRDVREHGIPIKTIHIVDEKGQRMAAYEFGDAEDLRPDLSGRIGPSATVKTKLIEGFGARCHLYGVSIPESELQIDHRIPYEIVGDSGKAPDDPSPFMLVSPAANRAKSMACQRCRNWYIRDPNTCVKCFWAYPESHRHVGMECVRMLVLTWRGRDVDEYEKLSRSAADASRPLSDHAKSILGRNSA